MLGYIHTLILISAVQNIIKVGQVKEVINTR